MSATIHRRVEALEAFKALRWVWRRADETVEQAKTRAGIDAGEPVIVFAWASSKPKKGMQV